MALSTAGVLVVGGVVIAGPATGFIAGGSWALINIANAIHNLIEERRIRVRLRVPSIAQPLPLRKRELRDVRLIPSEATAWSLRIDRGHRSHDLMSCPVELHDGHSSETVILSGQDALSAAGQILPQLNAAGARKHEVASAVRLIEDVRDPLSLFPNYAAISEWKRTSGNRSVPNGMVLQSLPTPVRLALEMAAHEESERRAMEGELALLESAWRRAEEIAAIADDLLLPPSIGERVGQMKESKATGR
jgi:hypothetical protein